MRLPKKARFTLVLAAALLSACSGDVTSPNAPAASGSVEAKSKFVPDAASMVLYGIKDGTYSFTIDPRKNNTLVLGPNRLELPANSVCDLASSGYGPSTWNLACKPHTQPVTITATVRSATSEHGRVDFLPAMRFNPATEVELFLYTPRVNNKDRRDWVMVYCPTTGRCIDESINDASLVSKMDRRENMLFRRIKHFSGYAALEFKETIDLQLP